jgi:hypothetical protein
MKSLSGNYVTGFLWVRAVTIAMQQLSKRTLNNGANFSVGSVQRGYLEDHRRYRAVSTRVEAGSNTSTVTLRVVGGDEKGSLKSETVKYGRESQGARTRE